MRAVTEPAAVADLVAREARENSRAMMWLMLPLVTRQIALAMCGLPGERAAGGLETFSLRERMMIRESIQRLMTDLMLAEQCMADGYRKSLTLPN